MLLIAQCWAVMVWKRTDGPQGSSLRLKRRQQKSQQMYLGLTTSQVCTVTLMTLRCVLLDLSSDPSPPTTYPMDGWMDGCLQSTSGVKKDNSDPGAVKY